MNIFIFPPSPANAMNGEVGKFWQDRDPKSQWMMDGYFVDLFFFLGQPDIDIFQYFNVETLMAKCQKWVQSYYQRVLHD